MKILFSSIIFITFSSVICYSQDFWEPTSGPEGGWVQCIAVDKQNNIFPGFNAGNYGYNHRGNCLYKSENIGISWQSLVIPSNKNVESIVFDTSGTIFIWTFYGGVYKSTNGGLGWTSISSGLDIYTHSILGACQNNFIVLANNYGIYLSTNNGNTWILSSLTDPVHSLFVDSSDKIFAGINYGSLYMSSDYGLTWIHVDNGLDGEVNTILQLDDSTYFSGTDAGIYKTSDNCASWSLQNGSPAKVTSLSKGINNEIFVGTSNNGFYISTNEGKNWEQRSNGLLNLNITCMVSYPENSIIIGTYGDGLFISVTQGQCWQPLNSGIKSVHTTALLKSNQYLFAGSQEGMLYKSFDNGDSWFRIDSTYTYMPVTAFLKTKKNSLLFASYDYPFKSENDVLNSEHILPEIINHIIDSRSPNAKIFKSINEGNTWNEAAQVYVNSFSRYYDPNSDKEYLLAAADYMGIMISTDDGDNWYPANNGIDGFSQDVATNSSGYFFASSSMKIFRSTDFGVSWQTIYTYPDLSYKIVLAVSKNDYIYAGFDWGKAKLSTDSGDSWIPLDLPDYGITSITTDSLNHVFVGDRGGNIFQSLDYGQHWTNISSGMIGSSIQNLTCDNSGNIYVGPYGGCVYRNATSTFAPQGVELIYPGIIAGNISLTPELKWHSSSSANLYQAMVSLNISFDSSDVVFDFITPDTTCIVDSLQMNTHYDWRVRCSNQYGWSLWSTIRSFRTINPVSIEQNEDNIFRYNLAQNYPNPFNPVTTIKYSIPAEGTSPVSSAGDFMKLVQLRVYNTIGEEVATLVNEEKPAGRYEVKFDGSKLPSGIYIYRLITGTYSAARKMIIIK